MERFRDFESSGEETPEIPLSGRRVVVAVGIDRYRHWPQLTNAVNDARGAYEAFIRLGFEELVPPLVDEAATAEAIRNLIPDKLRQLDEEDSLVLFFAGHGHTVTNTFKNGDTVKTGYIIGVDGEPPGGSEARWVRIDNWLSDIARLKAMHLLVVLDACNSGIAVDILRYRDAAKTTQAFTALSQRRSRRVITSALDDQRALDSGPLPGHSLFTGYLIQGLDGGIARHGDTITGSAIGQYLQREVARHPKSEQTPDFGALEQDRRGELLIKLVTTAGLEEDRFRREAEQRAREQAARQAREEAERKARAEAERKAREEAAAQARAEAAAQARAEAERKARDDAEREAREEKAHRDAERKARDEKARADAERKARDEKVRADAERKARDEKARADAERKARDEKARADAERKVRDEKARADAEADRKTSEQSVARDDAGRDPPLLPAPPERPQRQRARTSPPPLPVRDRDAREPGVRNVRPVPLPDVLERVADNLYDQMERKRRDEAQPKARDEADRKTPEKAERKAPPTPTWPTDQEYGRQVMDSFNPASKPDRQRSQAEQQQAREQQRHAEVVRNANDASRDEIDSIFVDQLQEALRRGAAAGTKLPAQSPFSSSYKRPPPNRILQVLIWLVLIGLIVLAVTHPPESNYKPRYDADKARRDIEEQQRNWQLQQQRWESEQRAAETQRMLDDLQRHQYDYKPPTFTYPSSSKK